MSKHTSGHRPEHDAPIKKAAGAATPGTATHETLDAASVAPCAVFSQLADRAASHHVALTRVPRYGGYAFQLVSRLGWIREFSDLRDVGLFLDRAYGRERDDDDASRAKRLSTLQAQAALAGVVLTASENNDGKTAFIVSRWALSKELASFDAVERWLDKVTGGRP
jgi:hypothetical protein